MYLMVGLFLFSAFICHHNSFLIYGSLEQRTVANWSWVTHLSVGSALMISAAFAVAGYTTFTGYTQGISQRVVELWCLLDIYINVFLILHDVFLVLCLDFVGDIFENYCREDNLATFGRFCFGLSVITTFPLECFVTREVSDSFLFTSLRIWNLQTLSLQQTGTGTKEEFSIFLKGTNSDTVINLYLCRWYPMSFSVGNFQKLNMWA